MIKEYLIHKLPQIISNLRRPQLVYSGTASRLIKSKDREAVPQILAYIKEYLFEDHVMNDLFEFCHVLQGSCVIRLEDTAYVCKTGDLCAILPGERHYESYVRPEKPYRIMWIFSRGSKKMEAHIGEYTQGKYSIRESFRTAVPADMAAAARKCQEVLQSNRPAAWYLAKGALLECFGRAAMLLENETSIRINTRHVPTQEDWRKRSISGVKRYIEEHYADPIRLPDIARQMGLTPRYVSRLFKQYFGMGAMEYLLEMRMMKANDFLADPTLNISEVSCRTGYENIYHFSRIFKKFYGYPPSRYRNTVLAGKKR